MTPGRRAQHQGRGTFGSRRRLLLAILPALGAIFLGIGDAAADPSEIAGKQAQARAVLEQIRAMDVELEQAVEAWNGANVELGRLDGELRANKRHLTVARSSLTAAQRHISERLVSLYVNGGDGDVMEILLGAESLDDLLSRIDAVERVSAQDAKVLAEMKKFKREVQERKLRLQKARVKQTQVVAQKAAARSEIERRLSSRQSMLASIRGQIEQLQAAEQRRQERLAAQARARLAAQESSTEINALGTVGEDEEAVSDGAEATTAPPAPPSQYGGVVGIAMQYLGVPYRWGGADPSGFDCSGLIRYAYSQVGVSLPHHAASQYGMGVPVSREELQPGDLVFFHGLGHAGIYIGGGQMIHAPQTGDVVKISDITSGWYGSTYEGARRIT
jgi:cell wall-associated NlpC family hydrolase